MGRAALSLIALALSASLAAAQQAAVAGAASAYAAALQDAEAAMRSYVADLAAENPEPQSVADKITSATEKRFADATKEAEKSFDGRLSDLKDADQSNLDTRVAAALEAADEVKNLGQRKARGAHALYSQMREASKAKVLSKGAEVKKLALKAKASARTLEKVKKRIPGEAAEEEAEGEFEKNEQRTEGMEEKSEQVREQAEQKVEHFAGRVEKDVEKWGKGVVRDAAEKSEDMRRSVSEARATAIAANKPGKSEAAEKEQPAKKTPSSEDEKVVASSVDNAATVDSASIPAASQALVFLAQLVFVVASASVAMSVVGLLPEDLLRGSIRRVRATPLTGLLG